jgi:hypothetical protein
MSRPFAAPDRAQDVVDVFDFHGTLSAKGVFWRNAGPQASSIASNFFATCLGSAFRISNQRSM